MEKKYHGQMVTITRQGQIAIPQSLRKAFKIRGSTKALIFRDGGTIVIEPKAAFTSLGGSLQSKVRLSDMQLRRARKNFAKEFGRKV